jgi:hypothetical protein
MASRGVASQARRQVFSAYFSIRQNSGSVGGVFLRIITRKGRRSLRWVSGWMPGVQTLCWRQGTCHTRRCACQVGAGAVGHMKTCRGGTTVTQIREILSDVVVQAGGGWGECGVAWRRETQKKKAETSALGGMALGNSARGARLAREARMGGWNKGYHCFWGGATKGHKRLRWRGGRQRAGNSRPSISTRLGRKKGGKEEEDTAAGSPGRAACQAMVQPWGPHRCMAGHRQGWRAG